MAVKAGESATDTGMVVKISELPIYEKPVVKVKLVPEEIGPYRKGISVVRSAIWSWLDSVQGTTNAVKDKYETGKAHTMSTIDYVQSNDVRPKVGLIGASGLTGLALTFRRGILQKTFACIFLMTAATAVCYPYETVDFTTKRYEAVKDAFKGKTD